MAKTDSSPATDISLSDSSGPADVADASIDDINLNDAPLGDTSQPEDSGVINDTGPPVEPCDPTTDSLCFSPCKDWDLLSLPPSVNVPGAMFIDMSGANGQEAFVFSGSGLLIADTNGNIVVNQTPVNAGNFARGIPVAADLTHPSTDTLFAKELSLFAAPGQKAAALTWVSGPEAGFKEFLFEPTDVPAYDLTNFMASDIDFDGFPELFSAEGCDPVVDILKVQPWLNPIKPGALIPWISLKNTGNSCDYNGGRLLTTQSDGDKRSELILGLGFANAEKTELWNGNIVVYDIDANNQQLIKTCGACFNTDKPPLHKAGVTDLFRQGSVIHAVVRYFTDKGPPAKGSTFYHWKYEQNGMPLGEPVEVDSPKALLPVRFHKAHPPVSVHEVRTVGLWDVNGDTYPDRLSTSGDELVLELYDPASQSLVEHKAARFKVGPNATVRSISHKANRLRALVAFQGGYVQCLEMGSGTHHRDGSIPPFEPPYYRTYQKDNFEPNDGDALPNTNPTRYRIPWLPSNLTAFGRAWGYLEDDLDEDYFQVKAVNDSEVCLRSPIDSQPYSFSLSSPTNPKTPIWQSKSLSPDPENPHVQCVTPNKVSGLKELMKTVEGTFANKIGLFVIRVHHLGIPNSDRPYWIDTPGILGWDGFNFGG